MIYYRFRFVCDVCGDHKILDKETAHHFGGTLASPPTIPEGWQHIATEDTYQLICPRHTFEINIFDRQKEDLMFPSSEREKGTLVLPEGSTKRANG